MSPLVTASAVFLLITSAVVAPPPCGDVNEPAKVCGGVKMPKNCCGDLVCGAAGVCVEASQPPPTPNPPPPTPNPPSSSGCPATFSVDCISWSEEGGNCQALHAVVRLRDDAGQPVNGADVQVDPNFNISGGGNDNIRTTTASLSTNYQGEIPLFCGSDPLPFEGTTAAYCWQQGMVGAEYSIEVIDITWPDCPNAMWIPNVSTDLSTYTFTGEECS